MLPAFPLLGQSAWRIYSGLFLLTVLLSLSLVATLCKEWWPCPVSLDEPVLSWAELRHCAIALGLAMAVTVVNPYGWGLYVEIYDS